MTNHNVEENRPKEKTRSTYFANIHKIGGSMVVAGLLHVTTHHDNMGT